jgi:hypothetical protein
MTGWQTALIAYLVALLLAVALLGPYLASVRRRYPLVRPPAEHERKEDAALTR